MKRYYPKLAPLVRTKLLQSGKGVLETFDKNMQDMALSSLLSSGVEVILNARGVWQNVTLCVWGGDGVHVWSVCSSELCA